MGDTPSVPVDLRADGVLWMVNRTVFHPRGFALAVDPDDGTLSLMGDGSCPWNFALGEDDEDGTPIEQGLLSAFRQLCDRAWRTNPLGYDPTL